MFKTGITELSTAVGNWRSRSDPALLLPRTAAVPRLNNNRTILSILREGGGESVLRALELHCLPEEPGEDDRVTGVLTEAVAPGCCTSSSPLPARQRLEPPPDSAAGAARDQPVSRTATTDRCNGFEATR